MDDIINKVVKVSDLADYQVGSVVSREVIQRNVGTVTVFAFDKGQGLSEHSAPFDAMVQVIDGEGEITIDGKLNIVKTGEMIIMPADIPHALLAKKPFKMVLTMIRG